MWPRRINKFLPAPNKLAKPLSLPRKISPTKSAPRGSGKFGAPVRGDAGPEPEADDGMDTMEAVEDPEETVEAPGSGPDDLADDSTDGTLCSCVAECWVLGEEEAGEVGMPGSSAFAAFTSTKDRRNDQ